MFLDSKMVGLRDRRGSSFKATFDLSRHIRGRRY